MSVRLSVLKRPQTIHRGVVTSFVLRERNPRACSPSNSLGRHQAVAIADFRQDRLTKADTPKVAAKRVAPVVEVLTPQRLVESEQGAVCGGDVLPPFSAGPAIFVASDDSNRLARYQPRDWEVDADRQEHDQQQSARNAS